MPTTAPKGIAQAYASFLESTAAKPPPRRQPVVLDELQLLDKVVDLRETL